MAIFIVFLRLIMMWYVEVYRIKWKHLYTGAFLDMNYMNIVTYFFPQYFHIIDSIRARKGKVLFVLPDFLLFRFTQPTPKNIWQCSAYCTHEYHHAHTHSSKQTWGKVGTHTHKRIIPLPRSVPFGRNGQLCRSCFHKILYAYV